MKNASDEDSDEMRPEYDLSKLKFIGRGIYAERFRRGTKLTQLIEGDRGDDEEQSTDDDLRPEYDFSNIRIVKRGPARNVKRHVK